MANLFAEDDDFLSNLTNFTPTYEGLNLGVSNNFDALNKAFNTYMLNSGATQQQFNPADVMSIFAPESTPDIQAYAQELVPTVEQEGVSASTSPSNEFGAMTDEAISSIIREAQQRGVVVPPELQNLPAPSNPEQARLQAFLGQILQSGNVEGAKEYAELMQPFMRANLPNVEEVVNTMREAHEAGEQYNLGAEKAVEEKAKVLSEKPSPNWFVLLAAFAAPSKAATAGFLKGYWGAVQNKFQNEQQRKLQYISDKLEVLKSKYATSSAKFTDMMQISTFVKQQVAYLEDTAKFYIDQNSSDIQGYVNQIIGSAEWMESLNPSDARIPVIIFDDAQMDMFMERANVPENLRSAVRKSLIEFTGDFLKTKKVPSETTLQRGIRLAEEKKARGLTGGQGGSTKLSAVEAGLSNAVFTGADEEKADYDKLISYQVNLIHTNNDIRTYWEENVSTVIKKPLSDLIGAISGSRTSGKQAIDILNKISLNTPAFLIETPRNWDIEKEKYISDAKMLPDRKLSKVLVDFLDNGVMQISKAMSDFIKTTEGSSSETQSVDGILRRADEAFTNNINNFLSSDIVKQALKASGKEALIDTPEEKQKFMSVAKQLAIASTRKDGKGTPDGVKGFVTSMLMAVGLYDANVLDTVLGDTKSIDTLVKTLTEPLGKSANVFTTMYWAFNDQVLPAKGEQAYMYTGKLAESMQKFVKGHLYGAGAETSAEIGKPYPAQSVEEATSRAIANVLTGYILVNSFPDSYAVLSSIKSGGMNPQDEAFFKQFISTKEVPATEMADKVEATVQEGDMDFTNLKKRIKNFEKFMPEVYTDVGTSSTGPAIGYGHRLSDKEKIQYAGKKITQKEADVLFEQDFEEAKRQAESLPAYANAPQPVREVLIDMCYQMGLGEEGGKHGVLSFKNTLPLIEQGKYSEAADNLLKSTYGTDEKSRKRARYNADILRSVAKDMAKGTVLVEKQPAKAVEAKVPEPAQTSLPTGSEAPKPTPASVPVEKPLPTATPVNKISRESATVMSNMINSVEQQLRVLDPNDRELNSKVIRILKGTKYWDTLSAMEQSLAVRMAIHSMIKATTK